MQEVTLQQSSINDLYKENQKTMCKAPIKHKSSTNIKNIHF